MVLHLYDNMIDPLVHRFEKSFPAKQAIQYISVNENIKIV